MKKNLFMILLFCSIYFALLQTFSQSQTYTFSYYGSGTAPCHIASDPQWKTSHGSPSYSRNPTNNQGDYIYLLLRTSYNNYTTKSEGAFVSYNFKKSNKYRITILSRSQKGMPSIFAYAANGLNGKLDTCKLAVFPTNVSDKEEIGWVYAGCDGFIPDIFTCADYIPSENSSWNPKKPYSYFWISSNLYAHDTTSLFVHTITITDLGAITPPGNPQNLQVTNTTGNSITVQWDPSTPGDYPIAKYEVFRDGFSWSTTTNTEFSFNNLTPCKKYELAVQAVDINENKSSKTSIIDHTTAVGNIVKNTPVDLSTQPNKRLLLEAENYILLSPGFSVKANDETELFIAMIGCSSVSSKNFEQNEDTEEDDIVETFYNVLDNDTDNVMLTNLIKKNDIKETSFITSFPNTNNEILIYPNPSSEKITVEYHAFTGNERIMLFDIAGRPLISCWLSGMISNIDITPFSPGVYLIKVITQEKIIVHKLIKM